MAFNIQYTPFITIWNDKKSCFVLWPGFFGLRPVFGIFLAFRRPDGLLQAKKIPKTALRPKNLAAAQKNFLSFLMLILSCISP